MKLTLTNQAELKKSKKEKLLERICEDWCEWPVRCRTEDELYDEHCINCQMEEAVEGLFA